MANFPPFRNYLFYCLDQLIKQYGLKTPFLDVGCGAGDFSRFLAKRGWNGKAIDSSSEAVQEARKKLEAYSALVVEQQDLNEENGKYRSIFLLDILEHIEDDRQALRKVSNLLETGGFLALAVPSNPRYWGWDDDFYGHVRRYTLPELKQKLSEVGLEMIVAWDFTYPFFTFLRWLHLKLSSNTSVKERASAAERTSQSGLAPEWQKSFGSRILIGLTWIWQPLYWVMFTFFRKRVLSGHELIVLARAKN